MSISSELVTQSVPKLEKPLQNDHLNEHKLPSDVLSLKKDKQDKNEDENGVTNDQLKK